MMTKTEDGKIETIETKSQPKGTEKIEMVEPQVIELPSYQYGNSQNTLDYNIALRNKPSGGKVKTLIFERLASVGTGTQSFTGFGFTPTSYTIQTTRTGITTTFYPCFSDGAYDGITQMIRQVADGYSRVLTGCVGRLLYTNQGGGTTNIVHSSLDTDGITLNFTTSSEDCYLVITCYG